MAGLRRIVSVGLTLFIFTPSQSIMAQSPQTHARGAAKMVGRKVSTVRGTADWSPKRPPSRSPSGQLARLVENPNRADGLPRFALADKSGTIQRYVEPVRGIDLRPFVGQVVVVRHDTGRTLLASQLELPARPPAAQRPKAATDARGVGVPPEPTQFTPASPPAGNMQLADYQEPEPDVAETIESLPAANSNPTWVEEEVPAGVDTGYHSPTSINSPISTNEFDGEFIHSECYPGCGCTPTCGYPTRQRGFHGYRDRGLFAGLFDDRCRPSGCCPGARGDFYARFDYLIWWFDGMNVPPLVVRGDPVDPDMMPGTGDEFLDNARVVVGGGELMDDARHGGRIGLGWYMDACGLWALEGDYLTFGQISDHFFEAGFDGDAEGVGRPFFAVPPGQDVVEDVYFPDEIQGFVTVNLSSRFEAAGIRLRHNLCCLEGAHSTAAGCGSCVECGGTVGCGDCCGYDPCRRRGYGTRRIDVAFGLRYANLEEHLAVHEELETLPLPPVSTFVVDDMFGTDNDFIGPEIGFIWEWEYRRWTVELLSRLAVGNTRQRVVINGATSIDGGPPLTGGLLAQSTNIGTYSSDKLSVLPEIGLTLGYQLSANLSFRLGYTFLYWSNVVRPGDQVDLDVNPDLIPRDTPPPMPSPVARPRVLFNETDFWAHGLNIGFEYRR